MRITSIFRPKIMRRIVLLMAMVAPIIYLFGTQFMALAGAHGEHVLETGATSDIAPSYEELMTPEKFSYDAFEWENEHGTRLGFSLGKLTPVSSVDNLVFWLYAGFHGINVYVESGIVDNLGTGWADTDDQYFDIAFYYEAADDSSLISNEESVGQDIYFCFYTDNGIAFVVDSQSPNIRTFSYSNGNWVSFGSSVNVYDMFFPDETFYFDDGQNLPAGISWNDELASYFVPTVKPVEVETYSASLFGSMFSDQNFLAKLGRSVLDDEFGFHAMNQYIGYCDTWLGLSHSALGLMAYGYMAWVCYVLLCNLVAMVLVWLFTFPIKIYDKLQGGIDL